MDEKIRKLRAESKSLPASVIIGKNGLNDETIINIKRLLRDNRVVKLKILSTYMQGKDKKEVANDIAHKCDGRIVDLIGFSLSLTRS